MITLTFQIEINAAPEKIWEVLWSDLGYRKWTEIFTPGSYAESEDWKTGSLVRFLSPKGHGLYALIEEHIPNRSMIFKQLGLVNGGINQAIDAETAVWSGCKEIYHLDSSSSHPLLTVTLETQEESVNYFNEVFPKALARIRELTQS